MPENDSCVATLVEITGTLADISSITASVFDSEVMEGYISLPASVAEDFYEGPYEVIPSAHNDIILDTDHKTMTDDVTVFKIPYFETSNTSGYTVYIGSEVI